MSRLGRFAPAPAVIVRALPGVVAADSTATATAGATATATATNAIQVQPLVVGDRNGPYLVARRLDPVTIVVPPVQDGGPVTGDATGAVTAGAIATASATSPGTAPARPVVVSDPAAALRARQIADTALIVVPPLVDAPAGTADATGAVTASATATAGAVSPGRPAGPVVMQGDQLSAYLTRARPDPVTLVVPPVQDVPAGPATQLPARPIVYTDPGLVFWARSGQYETALIVFVGANPTQAAGTATGAATASATATASAIPPAFGDAVGAVTASATAAGQVGPLAVANRVATASATASAHAASAGAALGAVTASAVATASESGGNFHPVGRLVAFGRRLIVIVASSRRGGRNG